MDGAASQAKPFPPSSPFHPVSRTLSLQDLAALVRAPLARLNEELRRDLAPGQADLLPLIEHVGGYRGKQLRPVLVFLSGMAVRGDANSDGLTSDHVEVAKVVELLHTATLIHDDVLDGADLRRRIPTLHALHGNEVSVLLGDYVYAQAFHMAVQLEDPTCARLLADTVKVICQGEITQILHRFDFEWTTERYFEVIAEKTASLYAAGCRLGGYYSGGNAAALDALTTFGTELGNAFQIVDDCLDLEGDEATVGKSLGTDLAKGKLTLPLLELMQSGDAGNLREVMAEGVDPHEALAALRARCDLASAVARAHEEARRRTGVAREALRVLPPGPAVDALDRIAEFVLERDV